MTCPARSVFTQFAVFAVDSRLWVGILLSLCLISSWGCASLSAPSLGMPSNDRDWRPELATLATAEFDGDLVHVKNIRNCSYLTEDVYVVDHYDKTFDLNRLTGVDFIIVPFNLVPSLAHTMLSFEFDAPSSTDADPSSPRSPQTSPALDKEYVAVSAEARLERGESYSPLKGSARQFEMMYVIADERDVLRLRTEHRKVDVYVHRVRADPQRVRNLFVHVLERANQLADRPEFYDTITNNCTNNIVRHINTLRPGRIPWDPRMVLPGMSDQLAYELGLLDTTRSFSELKREAHINAAARRAAHLPDFSMAIRRREGPSKLR